MLDELVQDEPSWAECSTSSRSSCRRRRTERRAQHVACANPAPILHRNAARVPLREQHQGERAATEKPRNCGAFDGADARTRTGDPFITRHGRRGLGRPRPASSAAFAASPNLNPAASGRPRLDAQLDTHGSSASATCSARAPPMGFAATARTGSMPARPIRGPRPRRDRTIARSASPSRGRQSAQQRRPPRQG
jgi:hypothetical protein